ncbi:hypothetical protein [Sphingomonas carotinifaciens]|uniref:hypothetical protein n=1 Tax=Sphingomonas carotinifaciens TaxID=1166323 RepID=UPI001F3918E2|nr:hypothetical protein [Sphingomonas carotinifaciens]
MFQLLARRLQRAGKLSLNMDEKTGGTSIPDGLPQAYSGQIVHELRLIGELG